MTDPAQTGWRELWLTSADTPAGSTFRFTLARGGAFVAFRRADRSAALHVAAGDRGLVLSEKTADGTWRALHAPIPAKGAEVAVAVTVTPGGVRVSGPTLAAAAELAVAFGTVQRVFGAGEITGLEFHEAPAPQTDAARGRIHRAVADLPVSDDPGRRRPGLIFDFGLHNGDDTAFYLAKGFDVVAVEANPQLADQAAARFAKAVVDGRLTIVNLGIADGAAEMPFYVSQVSSEQSSFDPDMAKRLGPVRQIQVRTVHPARLWRAFGVPYYAKIDIEGFDAIVLASLRDLAQKPAYVSFESGFGGWERAVASLGRSGYSAFKPVDQKTVPRAALPDPALEGRYVAHRFAEGSSGPFGAETAGRWLEATELKAGLDALRRANPGNRGWIDIHARHRTARG